MAVSFLPTLLLLSAVYFFVYLILPKVTAENFSYKHLPYVNQVGQNNTK